MLNLKRNIYGEEIPCDVDWKMNAQTKSSAPSGREAAICFNPAASPQANLLCASSARGLCIIFSIAIRRNSGTSRHFLSIVFVLSEPLHPDFFKPN
jgi:hypothetical protein